jgi:hypothetical protein
LPRAFQSAPNSHRTMAFTSSLIYLFTAKRCIDLEE